MSANKTFFSFVLALMAIIGAIVVVVGLGALRAGPAEKPEEDTATPVRVVEAHAEQARFEVRSEGTVEPVIDTRLSAEVGGRVVEVSPGFVAGGYFKAGEVLMRIDPADYQTAVVQAEAELASAEARLSEEQARSDQARRDWQQARGSDAEPNPLILRLPQVAGAQAAVKAAEASLARAQRNLERTAIRLPFDGIVRSRSVDLGQFITAGSELGQAFAVQAAEVRLALAEKDLAFLDLPTMGGAPGVYPDVQLSATLAGEQRQWQASIVRTEAVIDSASRLRYAVARIEDPYNLAGQTHASALPMGAFVEASIEGRSAQGLVRLPRGALHQNNRVYLATDSNELAVEEVQVVRSTVDSVYVQGGVSDGDRIITTAMSNPVPGQRLKVEGDDVVAGGTVSGEEDESVAGDRA